MEDSVPNLLKNGSKDINEPDNVKEEEEEIGSRIEQNLFLFFLNVILCFVVSFQNIIFVFTNN